MESDGGDGLAWYVRAVRWLLARLEGPPTPVLPEPLPEPAPLLAADPPTGQPPTGQPATGPVPLGSEPPTNPTNPDLVKGTPSLQPSRRLQRVGGLVGPAEERYVSLTEIGRGGMGRVLEVVDKNIRRRVAMKVMPLVKAEKARDQFVHEAQITAQLEHPSIVPTYDLGTTQVEGTPSIFYTMKRIRGTRYTELIAAYHRKRERDPVERRQLLRVLASVCQAIDYAHSRGVLHRDLKPDNIMVGDFGEVHVLDWGIAEVDVERENGVRTILTEVGQGGRLGGIAGTPGYLPPEVLDSGPLGPHTDVYALGVILYSVLCGQRPFDGRNAMALLLKASREAPPSPRDLRPDVPVALSDLAMRCLERDWERRIASARVLHDTLTGILERADDDDRRQAQAHRLVEAAFGHSATYLARIREHRRLAREAASAPDDRRAWELDARQRALELEGLAAFAAAENAFHKALEFDAGHAQARAGLADITADRLLHEEERGNVRPSELAYLHGRLEAHDDGRYRDVLGGEGSLRVLTEPPGARVFLYRFVQRSRDGAPVPWRDVDGSPEPEGADERAFVGTAPLFRLGLPIGDYLLVARHEGRRDGTVSFALGRGRDLDIVLQLRREAEVGAGFVQVPAGRATAGGDPRAEGSWPKRVVDVPEFFVGRFPVSCAEYRAFLDHLGERGGERVPRRGATPLWHRTDGRWEYGVDPEIAWSDDRPVVGVSAADAEAWCAWRTERDGRRVRLPREVQWEKAARGGDGRVHPWGPSDRAVTLAGGPLPLGACAFDVSPFGVRDLVSNVLEWCSDPFHPELPLRAVRGGGRLLGSPSCRAAARRGFDPAIPRLDTGFRVVSDQPARA